MMLLKRAVAQVAPVPRACGALQTEGQWACARGAVVCTVALRWRRGRRRGWSAAAWTVSLCQECRRVWVRCVAMAILCLVDAVTLGPVAMAIRCVAMGKLGLNATVKIKPVATVIWLVTTAILRLIAAAIRCGRSWRARQSERAGPGAQLRLLVVLRLL